MYDIIVVVLIDWLLYKTPTQTQMRLKTDENKLQTFWSIVYEAASSSSVSCWVAGGL